MQYRLQWSTQPELIQQIIDGIKRATVSRVEWSTGYDDYTTALHVGGVYTVYNGAFEACCQVRLTRIELVRWAAIPERLWLNDPSTTGQTSLQAFVDDHYDFFDRPDDDFEFLGVYFHRVDA